MNASSPHIARGRRQSVVHGGALYAPPNGNARDPSCNMRARPNGFTLIEVLVALVVATLGILAVTSTVLTAARTTNSLREESLAHWVAMNVAAELRLADEWPDIGNQDGDVEFAGSEWRWNAQTSATDVEGLRRVEIEVAYAETPDDTVADVVAFVGRPVRGLQFREWTGPAAGRRNLRAGP